MKTLLTHNIKMCSPLHFRIDVTIPLLQPISQCKCTSTRFGNNINIRQGNIDLLCCGMCVYFSKMVGFWSGEDEMKNETPYSRTNYTRKYRSCHNMSWFVLTILNMAPRKKRMVLGFTSLSSMISSTALRTSLEFTLKLITRCIFCE